MKAFLHSILLLALLASSSVFAADWSQWRGPSRDGRWDQQGVFEKFPGEKLEPLWSAPVGAGYNGPTVAEGRVYVMDRMTEPEEQERVHCFDADTGKAIWSFAYPCPYQLDYPLGPRASVSVDEGRAYALGAMGHFHAFDAVTGDVIWKKDFVKDYEVSLPIWGLSSSPLVDGDRLILMIGAPNGAGLVAFNKKTGEEIWRSTNEPASYSAPILVERNGERVLIAVTGENVVGLAPETGEVYWTVPFKPTRMIMHVPTPVVEGDRIFLSSFFDGSLMLKFKGGLKQVEEVWRERGVNEIKTKSLHSTIGTPFIQGDHVYGVDSYGQLRCLDANTGERIWEDQGAVPHGRWATIHFVRNGDKVWMFTEQGNLIIARFDPTGYHEISRTKIIEPTTELGQRDYLICWMHPAFAGKRVYARNDKELVCVKVGEE